MDSNQASSRQNEGSNDNVSSRVTVLWNADLVGKAKDRLH